MTASSPGATAAPPFTKAWSVGLGSAVSAPVAVGGKVFVVVNAAEEEESGGPRMELVGLDAATGKRLRPQHLITGDDSVRPHDDHLVGGRPTAALGLGRVDPHAVPRAR
ncbi:hypothetical protein AB0D40_14255 [Streptomyces massasporeus]|uniref:hypothetical protein n=1 Tax=Streptomyces massasporeus TaxID=67324 RepID=UPI0033FD3537